MIAIIILSVFIVLIAKAFQAGTGKTLAQAIQESNARENGSFDAEYQEITSETQITRECLTEQLLFVEDLISSETNPDRTLKYMKEKQKILTALANL